MEIIMLILGLILFLTDEDRWSKTDAERMIESYKTDSMSMWWERIRTGKENRKNYMSSTEYQEYKDNQ